MKRFSILIIVMALFSGCLKDPTALPMVEIDQFQDVTQTDGVCHYAGIPFVHYTFQGDTLSDSIQWYQHISGGTVFLGTGFRMEIPTYPYPQRITRFEFHGNDTVIAETGFGLCYHALYIPNAFSPYGEDGINDTWYPIFYNTEPIWSMTWKVLSTDGIVLFETTDTYGKWDGDGSSPGPYLYDIQIDIPDQESQHYSGVFHLID